MGGRGSNICSCKSESFHYAMVTVRESPRTLQSFAGALDSRIALEGSDQEVHELRSHLQIRFHPFFFRYRISILFAADFYSIKTALFCAAMIG